MLISLQHVADLLPGVIHVRFGVRLDDLRSIICWDAEARIEIQTMDPVRWVRGRSAVRVEQHPLGQSVPSAVQRRGDQRVGIVDNVRKDRLRDSGRAGCDSARGVRVGRGFRRIVVRQVDEAGESLFEGVRVGLVPVLVEIALGFVSFAEVRIGDLQSAAQTQDAFQLGLVDPG